MIEEMKNAPRGRRKQKSQALSEIDRRLADAIVHRADALDKISQLMGWQERLSRLDREIETLINYMQRLTGQAPTVALPPPVMPPTAAIPYAHNTLPSGAGSIPARQPAPTPQGNAADMVIADGDFK